MGILIQGLKDLLKSLSAEQKEIIKKAAVDCYTAFADIPSFVKGLGPSRIRKTIDNLLDNIG